MPDDSRRQVDGFDRWQPDLVVYEPLAVAGALAAARRTVPAVLHENSLFDGAELVRVTAARLVRAQQCSGAAGVPQLVVPGPGDRRHNAALVAARGAGLAVAERAITAAELDRLVTDRSLATAAAEVRREMLAMPAPAELVPRLEALVG